MKKFEDVKILLYKTDSLLSPLIEDKKEQFIKTIRDDFSNFFNEKGFNINTDPLIITATYGGLVACLSHDEPNAILPSSEFMFDLNIESFNNKKYSIFIGKNAPSLKASGTPSIKCNNLQNDIEIIQKYIDESQIRITNFPHEVWKLFIKEKSANYGALEIQVYDSINEFFNTLFE
jgi:hypothetical protein